MDEKLNALKAVINPVVKHVVKELPDSPAKDYAIAKLQELVWWCEKTLQDEKARQDAAAQNPA